MDRRNFITSLGMVTAAFAAKPLFASEKYLIKEGDNNMSVFQLPELPYSKSALKPFITEETFDYHHGKHHAAYVNNLNNLIKDSKEYYELSLEKLIQKSADEKKVGIFNNAAQHWNHTFFWNCMSPNGGSKPTGKIAELIDRDFGSFENFKEKLSQAAVTLFGSGWAWLVENEQGKLEIVQYSNADTPIIHNKKPLITIDVWEHAYYIDYRNARPKFVEGFWDVVNWENANNLLLK